jgi:hypothetical protein
VGHDGAERTAQGVLFDWYAKGKLLDSPHRYLGDTTDKGDIDYQCHAKARKRSRQ